MALADLDASPDAARVPSVHAMAREAQAEILAGQGALVAAVAELQTARQLWLVIRHGYHAVRLQLRLADLLERAGDPESAGIERGAAHLAAARIGARGLTESA